MIDNKTDLVSLFNSAGFGNILTSMTEEHNISSEQINGLGASILPLVKNAISNGISDTSTFTNLLKTAQSIDLSSLTSGILSNNSEESGKNILALLSGGENNISSTLQKLASDSGIGQEILSKIIPTLGTSILAVFMKQGGGLSSLISSFTSSDNNSSNDSTGGLIGLPNSFLDKDRDGSALDDLGEMLKKLM